MLAATILIFAANAIAQTNETPGMQKQPNDAPTDTISTTSKDELLMDTLAIDNKYREITASLQPDSTIITKETKKAKFIFSK